MQAAKDREINRLSNALYESQRDVDESKRKLEQVHSHTLTMEEQKPMKARRASLGSRPLAGLTEASRKLFVANQG